MASLIDIKQIEGFDSSSLEAIELRVTALEVWSTSLDTAFVTEVELSAYSQSVNSDFVIVDNRLDNLELFSSSLSSSLSAIYLDFGDDYVTSTQLLNATQSVLNNHNLISGSLQLNSSSFDSLIITNISATGSFTGTFIGDGSGLTGIIHYTDNDVLNYINSLGVLSGSNQIALEISGAFNELSESFDYRLNNLEFFSSSLNANFVSEAELTVFSTSIDTEIYNFSSSIVTTISSVQSDITQLNIFTSSYYGDSASFDTRLDLLEDFSNSVDITFIDEFELQEAVDSVLNDNGLVSGSHFNGSVTLNNDIYISGNVILGDNEEQIHEITGSLKLKNSICIGDSLLQNYQNPNVVDFDNIIASVSASLYRAVFFEYVIFSGSNIRAGNLVSTHTDGNVVYFDQSTQDIGDTSTVELRTEIQGENLVLLANSNFGVWNIKTFLKGL
jgi:hypothetical protein